MNHPMPSNPQSKQVKPSEPVNSTQSGTDLNAGYAVKGYENILPIDFHDNSVRLHQDDCLNRLKAFPDSVFDSVVTDPPYALVSITKRFGSESSTPCAVKPGASGAYARASAGFMGQKWDTGETAFAVEFWAEVLRVLKPGGHVVAFGGTRTYHRLACAIEDAGFEIRDQLGWCYGTGFPKSHDVALSFEKALTKRVDHVEVIDGNPVKVVGWVYLDDGAPMVREAPFRHPMANQWAGWGTALKPAWEPICLGRKPLVGTVAENVAAYGVGALNIDGCRIGTDDELRAGSCQLWSHQRKGEVRGQPAAKTGTGEGRFPANVLHDGSAEVVAAFPSEAGGGYGTRGAGGQNGILSPIGGTGETVGFGDAGSAARFFYSAKASKLDRLGSLHPTVKPVDLMRWLVRLVTPPGGLVLDPFAGSGTTGHAAVCEGRRAVLIEREPKFCRDIVQRMNCMDPHGQPKPRKRPAKPRPPDPWAGTLFATAMAARQAQTKVADKACALVQNRAIMEEQAQPSSSPPTTDSARAVSDDGQARPAMLHAAE